MTVAALYVETGGGYFDLPGVDPYDITRDARAYIGPHPVVAHPPCQRWGRFATGSTRKPGQYRIGEDGGCFAAALTSVRNYGGVLEHPKDSLAWEWFGIMPPRLGSGWQRADNFGGWTCQVEQGHYGHFSRKPTWLYAVCATPPGLIWGKAEQRLPAYAVERYGYEKARRIGVMAAVGGKHKTRIRNATPAPFRDLLLSIARSAQRGRGGMTPDYPSWICQTCGETHGRKSTAWSTWHPDTCGWCGKQTSCTEPRDYAYPAHGMDEGEG